MKHEGGWWWWALDGVHGACRCINFFDRISLDLCPASFMRMCAWGAVDWWVWVLGASACVRVRMCVRASVSK